MLSPKNNGQKLANLYIHQQKPVSRSNGKNNLLTLATKSIKYLCIYLRKDDFFLILKLKINLINKNIYHIAFKNAKIPLVNG